MAFETWLLWLLPLPPLLAFALILFYTSKNNTHSTVIALAGVGLSFLASMAVFMLVLLGKPISGAIHWMPIGQGFFDIGVSADALSAVTLFFVAWTVLAIFVYSIGYHNYGQPKGRNDQPGLPPQGVEQRVKKVNFRIMSVEPLYARFFALISLFAFAMFLLVVSDNLLTLYIGWEVMGFCSYMLIGFWYQKPSARDAAVKAFLTTRVGDVFLLIGLVGLYKATGTLQFKTAIMNPELMANLAAQDSGILGLSMAGLLGILIFIGVIGKSAQFPLHIWLPDAMEGPTPVSAMIHAATMVSAGIYLTARVFPLLSAGWDGGALTDAMRLMAFIGAFTALFAATIALAQNDIKRVLAYSTISQLGYMIAALGIGAYTAAVFHLFTHAFFKALLFLGSGSVIHGMEHGAMHTGEHLDVQDMQNMGGLRSRMPVTFWTFVAGGLSLAGFPLLTAGFWSKDEILAGAFGAGQLAIFITLALAALLTAIYTARQITLTFLGQPRSVAAENAEENKAVMTIPLIVLAVFAVGAGWVGIPQAFPGLGALSANWFGHFVGQMNPELAHHEAGLIPLIVSVSVSLFGLVVGYLLYRKIAAGQADPMMRLGWLYRVFHYKYGIDELYQAVLIRPALVFSEKISYKLIDQGILDGVIHAIARGATGIGSFLRRFIDIPLWNRGLTDGTGAAVNTSGALLRQLQNGKVQQYLLLSLIPVTILTVVLVILWR